jgi:hypothetical protein
VRSIVVSGLALLSTAIHFPVAGSPVEETPSLVPENPLVQAWTRPARSRAPLVALARPSPLTAAEEANPGIQGLARRFNPAMVMPIPEIWPVEVRYAWHDGADLVAEVKAEAGLPARRWVAVPAADLARRDWSRLPHQLSDGRPIRYYVDAPGDDRPVAATGISGWRTRFRDIAGRQVEPAASQYPPTQYAHLFWWNRDAGLLAIQYWFYYPFNEWVNHHEADWEHVVVVLQGIPRLQAPGDEAGATALGHLFFFHDSWLQPRRLVRLDGTESGTHHPVVFVGGEGRLLAWDGPFSGGSYPLPGRYPRAGFEPRFLAPDEQLPVGARFLAPADFQVIVLPEPERLDGARHPELSWLRLPFFAGQRRVHINPPGYRTLDKDHPPVQPGVRRGWLSAPTNAEYPDTVMPTASFEQALRALPASWISRPGG